MEITLPAGYRPRPYQIPAWTHMEQESARMAQEKYEGLGARAALVWHRRAGKDLFSTHFCATQAFQRIGTYWHVLPTQRMGRQIVWEGKTRDGIPFLEAFPDALVDRRREDEMRMWLTNGSAYQIIGADEPDRLVGANPVGVIFSEWSLMSSMAWELVRPMLAENGGWAIFIYTPRGRNHGYRTLQEAQADEHWFAEVLPVTVTKAISQTVLDSEKRSMPPELYEQEYNCSFDAPLAGAYYGDLLADIQAEGRVTAVPYDPLRRVWTAWDLGIADATAIWFAQQAGAQLRVIDYYEASGVGLDHYAKVLGSKPYAYERHLFPHDAKVRELGTGRTRVEMLRKLGIHAHVLPNQPLQDGIQAVRALLPRCVFDGRKTQRGFQGLKEYTRERIAGEVDPETRRPIYRDRPKHDWTSHPADSFRTLAVGIRPEREKRAQLAPRLAIV